VIHREGRHVDQLASVGARMHEGLTATGLHAYSPSLYL